MESTKTIQTQRSEEQVRLAQEYGVEPKMVKLIDAVVQNRLERNTSSVKDLTAEIAGEEPQQAGTDARANEKGAGSPG